MEKKKKITTKQLILIVVGLLAFLYISGLLGQLLGGKGLILSPVSNTGYALKDGLLYTLLFGVGVIAIIVSRYKDQKFRVKMTDERNFAQSDLGTYGTSGFMPDEEIPEVVDEGTVEKAEGKILGEKDGKVLSTIVREPEPGRAPLNRHMAVYGATGSGKSACFSFNYIMQSVKAGESLIMTDPKAELFSMTARYLHDKGYIVRVFNLIDFENSDSWNCLAEIGEDPIMAQIFASVVIANTSEGKRSSDPFFENGEMNLLKALALLVQMDQHLLPEQKTMGEVYNRIVSGNAMALDAMFSMLSDDHPAKQPYNLFAQGTDNIKASVISGFGTRLQVFQNKVIRDITSYPEIDLTLPGKRKCAYFVITSDQDSTMNFLSSLFFSFLFIKLVHYADAQPDARTAVPVNFLLDEFPNIGQIPDFQKKLSTIRSRGLSVALVFQALSQLKNRYPFDVWQEIIGGCDTQLFLGCSDELTGEFISKRLGEMTVRVSSQSVTKGTVSPVQLIDDYKETHSIGKRRVMTCDEVQRLDSRKAIIIIRGQKGLKCDKYFYKNHPESKLFKKASAQTHIPRWRRMQESSTKNPSGACEMQKKIINVNAKTENVIERKEVVSENKKAEDTVFEMFKRSSGDKF